MVSKTIEWVLAEPTIAFGFALLVLVLGYRMNAKISNLFLIIIFLLLTQAFFRIPAWNHVSLKVRLLSTLLFALVAIVSSCYLWASPISPGNVEAITKRWVKNLRFEVKDLTPEPQQYFGYVILFPDEPVNVFFRKDIEEESLMLEVTFPLAPFKEKYGHLSDKDRLRFFVELRLELAKAGVPAILDSRFERATCKRLIPIAGLTQTLFVDNLERVHLDGVIIRDTIALKLLTTEH